MPHRTHGFKLGRDTEHRKAMWRNMAISLFTHGQITTTVVKAKSVQPFVEKLITQARKGDLAARRRVLSMIGDPYLVKSEDDKDVERNRYGEMTDAPRVVKHLFETIGPRFADRAGGYTRIVKLGRHRLGDGGDLAVLQMVGDEEGPQLRGQHSRRREQADRRTAYAKKITKAANAAPAAQASVATETPEAPAAE